MHLIPAPVRLKPVHKVEGMTNGTAAGAGQQQQQQQGSGQVDISTQVQQYQQFLGEFSDGYGQESDLQLIVITLRIKCDFSLSIRFPCVPDASRALPEFPDIDLQGKSMPEGIELEHIKSFQLLYREHCEVTGRHPLSIYQFPCSIQLLAGQWKTALNESVTYKVGQYELKNEDTLLDS